jgi:hypothetical protein
MFWLGSDQKQVEGKMGFDYSSIPVNKIAALVTTQGGCSDQHSVTREGVKEILGKLQKRQAELKESLGIKTKSQLKNRKYYRKHPRQSYNLHNNRLFEELLENGLRIQEFANVLAEMKKTHKEKP